MSTMRDELHHLVDSLPDDRLAPVLALVRDNVPAPHRDRAIATLKRVRVRMHGVTGIDEELDRIRNSESRG
jgi:hypothetical protein